VSRVIVCEAAGHVIGVRSLGDQSDWSECRRGLRLRVRLAVTCVLGVSAAGSRVRLEWSPRRDRVIGVGPQRREQSDWSVDRSTVYRLECAHELRVLPGHE
jgi:hypothetical protein